MESVGAWVAVLQAGLSVLADTVGEEVKRASEGETAPSQALEGVQRERLMRFTVWPVIGDVCELKCDVLVFCLRFYVYVRRLYLYGDDTRTFPPLDFPGWLWAARSEAAGQFQFQQRAAPEALQLRIRRVLPHRRHHRNHRPAVYDRLLTRRVTAGQAGSVRPQRAASPALQLRFRRSWSHPGATLEPPSPHRAHPV